MRITLIAALDEENAIGKDNELPWHLPADLKRFKEATLGKPVIMGRRTFESIGSKPLPRRRNVILTRQPDFTAEGVEIAASADAARELLGDEEEIMILGGSAVYAAFLPLADTLILTRVHARCGGDTFFPAFDPSEWKTTESRAIPPDERNAIPMTFLTLERNR